MNKRQIKKRNKIISERNIFFNQHFVSISRRNIKSYLSRVIYKACISKKYKYFKELKKFIGGGKMLLTILIFTIILLTTSYIIADL